MSIQERLEIFMNAQMISEEESERIQGLCLIYEEEYQCIMSDESAERLITHLVSMFYRNKNKQLIEPISDFVMEQIINDPNNHRAQEMLSSLIQRFPVPEEEEGYILLHLIHCLSYKDSEEVQSL